jgi:hypothetical protein
MKRAILLFAILTWFSLIAFSQNFISENKQWNVRLSFFMSPSMEIYVIDGDSIYNSMVYKKMWMSYDSTLSGLMYQGLVREENNVVYYVPPNGTEGILYDFNLEVGESVFLTNMFCTDLEIEANVIGIDTVVHFGTERKRWELESEGWTEYWLEGIGSLSGVLHSFYPLCIICPVWELLCFHENDDLLYIMPGQTNCYQTSVGIDEQMTNAEIKIIPNPVNQGQAFEIETGQDVSRITIYNSSGVLVKQLFFVSNERIVKDTDDMTSDIYLIKIETLDRQEIMTKVVVH